MSKERNDLAYFSYYAGGFRVAKIQDGNLCEVGATSPGEATTSGASR
jgi:hypothetical protein